MNKFVPYSTLNKRCLTHLRTEPIRRGGQRSWQTWFWMVHQRCDSIALQLQRGSTGPTVISRGAHIQLLSCLFWHFLQLSRGNTTASTWEEAWWTGWEVVLLGSGSAMVRIPNPPNRNSAINPCVCASFFLLFFSCPSQPV